MSRFKPEIVQPLSQARPRFTVALDHLRNDGVVVQEKAVQLGGAGGISRNRRFENVKRVRVIH
jgi:hypothetical protein